MYRQYFHLVLRSNQILRATMKGLNRYLMETLDLNWFQNDTPTLILNLSRPKLRKGSIPGPSQRVGTCRGSVSQTASSTGRALKGMWSQLINSDISWWLVVSQSVSSAMSQLWGAPVATTIEEFNVNIGQQCQHNIKGADISWCPKNWCPMCHLDWACRTDATTSGS